MDKVKFILNILYWTFEILARACGHAEEILSTIERWQESKSSKRKRKKNKHR